MAHRKAIGLLFSYNQNWVAGAYYTMNIIRLLNTLPDNKKPLVIVFTDEEGFIQLQDLQYPFLQKFEYTMVHTQTIGKRIVNKICRLFTKKNYFDLVWKPHVLDKKSIQSIFPCYGELDDYTKKFIHPSISTIFWIPDFQEKYFPDFFSEEDLIYRTTIITKIASKKDPIVFSSKTALADYQNFYSDYKNKALHVYKFRVFLPQLDATNFSDIQIKYNIPDTYFMCPNQFWQHKNHMVVLQAIADLKQKNNDVHVVFTGKEQDYRNPDYFGSLQKFVLDNNIQNNIHFLGFIDRIDQLLIMKHAHAIVQPSLFEGWNTSIEDAMALQQFVIASNIPVHREQLEKNFCLFEPHNHIELSEKFLQIWKNRPTIEYLDYEQLQNQAAKQLIKMLL